MWCTWYQECGAWNALGNMSPRQANVHTYMHPAFKWWWSKSLLFIVLLNQSIATLCNHLGCTADRKNNFNLDINGSLLAVNH